MNESQMKWLLKLEKLEFEICTLRSSRDWINCDFMEKQKESPYWVFHENKIEFPSELLSLIFDVAVPTFLGQLTISLELWWHYTDKFLSSSCKYENINEINNEIWKSEEKSFYFSFNFFSYFLSHVGFDLFCDKNKKFSFSTTQLSDLFEIVTIWTIVFVFNIPVCSLPTENSISSETSTWRVCSVCGRFISSSNNFIYSK